jgi:3'-5' exonuclease
MSILQSLVSPDNRICLIDVHTLGHKTFSTAGATAQTLKKILESHFIPKFFSDARCDSDVLFRYFRIRLAGIYDIQLMELATRNSSKRFVNWLSKGIETCPWLQVRNRRGKESKRKDGTCSPLSVVERMRCLVLVHCPKTCHYIVFKMPSSCQSYGSQ